LEQHLISAHASPTPRVSCTAGRRGERTERGLALSRANCEAPTNGLWKERAHAKRRPQFAAKIAPRSGPRQRCQLHSACWAAGTTGSREPINRRHAAGRGAGTSCPVGDVVNATAAAPLCGWFSEAGVPAAAMGGMIPECARRRPLWVRRLSNVPTGGRGEWDDSRGYEAAAAMGGKNPNAPRGGRRQRRGSWCWCRFCCRRPPSLGAEGLSMCQAADLIMTP
jgi:hypothetical protein